MSQADFAAALLTPGAPCPAGLKAWNGSDPSARFAVYRNNVLSSLIDALADTFPVTKQLVGTGFFNAMADLFIRQNPPRSRVLAFLGDGFAEFIDRFEPARSLPYLADVARLEKAYVAAYHAADAQALTAEALGAALGQADDAADLRLLAHPSATALVSNFAILSVWAAHQTPEANSESDGDVVDLSELNPLSAESALLVRPALEVLVLRLPPAWAVFFQSLQSAYTLADAAALAQTTDPDFDLPGALAFLTRQGALMSAQPNEARSP